MFLAGKAVCSIKWTAGEIQGLLDFGNEKQHMELVDLPGRLEKGNDAEMISREPWGSDVADVICTSLCD